MSKAQGAKTGVYTGDARRVGTEHGPSWNPPKKSPVPPRPSPMNHGGRLPKIRRGPID